MDVYRWPHVNLWIYDANQGTFIEYTEEDDNLLQAVDFGLCFFLQFFHLHLFIITF